MSIPRKTAVWLTNSAVTCFRFAPGHRDKLVRAVPELDVEVCANQAQFLEALPEAELVLIWQFRQAWFRQAPRLRWIATPAAGRDYFQVQPPPGVRITYGTFHGILIGETVLAMMLALTRGVLDTARLQEHEPWPRAALDSRMRPLRGAHVTILGFGHIGEWIARLAKPFGVRLTGIKRNAGSRPAYFTEVDRLVTAAALDTVLPETDHLVVCLPRTAETDRILSARRLALLPAHAAVYNIGRGNAIDEQALAAALRAGRLRGACLDVYQEEPLPPNSPLRECPNLLLMPHASAFAPNYLDLFIDEFAALYRASGNAPETGQ